MPRRVLRSNPSALSFDGTDDYANWSYAKTSGATARTVAFWVKMRTFTANQVMVAFGTGSTAYESVMWDNTLKVIRFEQNGGAGGMRWNTPASSVPQSLMTQWTHIAYTRPAFTAANARVAGDITAIYINGSPITPATSTIGSATASMVNLTLGVTGTTNLTNDLNGMLDELLVYDRELSVAEITRLASGAPPPTDYDFYAPLNEGAGTAPVAIGVTGSTGVLSGTTYSSDVPFTTRRLLNGNLSYNGDFEYAPPSGANVATTTGVRWIDGTAGGSTTNNLFGWGIETLTGSGAALFDSSVKYSGNYSLKISTTATASRIVVGGDRTGSSTASPWLIPVQPSTSYTLSAMMKTLVNSGSATTGAQIYIVERDATGTFITLGSSTGVTTTQDWTQVTLTRTLGSTTRYVNVAFNLTGNNGGSDLIMDAWYDSVSFTPTQPIDNRLLLRDMKASLAFNGSTTEVATTSLELSGTEFGLALWVKPENGGSTNFGRVMDYAVDAGNTGVRLVANRVSMGFGYELGNGTNFAASGGVAPMTFNQWQHVVLNYAGSVPQMFKNGVAYAAGSRSVTMPAATATFYLGRRNTGTDFFQGKMAQLVVRNGSQFTQAEISALYQQGTIPTGATVVQRLDEGAGTTALDSSGNGNNGTITSGTFVYDAPVKPRQLVNANLVKNGNFEYAPPVNAPYTGAGQAWIDGTAAGSVTNGLFSWVLYSKTGSGSIVFDNTTSHSGLYSLKVSTTATASILQAGNVANVTGSTIGITSRSTIEVLPSTSYTLTFWMKTQLNSGSATSGAQIFVRETNAAAGQVAQAVANSPVITTTDWTLYSYTFTTNAATRYVILKAGVTGSDGAGTLIMDSWFDDIDFRATSPLQRI